MDFIILSHNKDYNKLPYVVSSIEQYAPYHDNIWIVCPDNNIPHIKGVNVLLDEEALPGFDRDLLSYRPNWIFQQIVKLYQKFSSDIYAVIDSDVILVRPLNIKPKFPMFYRSRPNFTPYVNFNNALGVETFDDLQCFISEIMIFDRSLLGNLFSSVGFKDNLQFYEFIYNTVTSKCFPSEYELYGNFVRKNYPDKYNFRQLQQAMNGKHYNCYKDDEIKYLIDKYKGKKDIITVHTWV